MEKFVALYGGSFNLSTFAHRAVGAAVRDLVNPDEVWYLVSPQNPHKSTDHMASFRDRIEMAKLNVCGMAKLIVTDIEEGISQKTGSTAASDTLIELQKTYPETHFAWIMGADNFTKLHTWHNYESIVTHVPIIVIPRAGSTAFVPTCPAALHPSCHELQNVEDIRDHKTGWYFLKQFPEGTISASDGVKTLSEGHRPSKSVHPAVLDYVTRHGLRFGN